MYQIALVFLGIFIGLGIGIMVGQAISEMLIKKKLNNTQCVNCKHFHECLGSWEILDNNNQCKIYQPKCNPKSIEENNLSLKKDIEDCKQSILTLSKKQEEMDDEINVTFYSIGEDLENLSKAVFPDDDE